MSLNPSVFSTSPPPSSLSPLSSFLPLIFSLFSSPFLNTLLSSPSSHPLNPPFSRTPSPRPYFFSSLAIFSASPLGLPPGILFPTSSLTVAILATLSLLLVSTAFADIPLIWVGGFGLSLHSSFCVILSVPLDTLVSVGNFLKFESQSRSFGWSECSGTITSATSVPLLPGCRALTE